MKSWKYRSKDGKGKIYNGKIEGKPFVDQIFGELERPLKADEIIDPVDGKIIKRTKSQAELDDASERAAIRNFDTVDLDNMTNSQLKLAVKWLIKREQRRAGG